MSAKPPWPDDVVASLNAYQSFGRTWSRDKGRWE